MTITEIVCISIILGLILLPPEVDPAFMLKDGKRKISDYVIGILCWIGFSLAIGVIILYATLLGRVLAIAT